MPIENDFTRVFGAIRELEERVDQLGISVDDLQQRVWSGGETVSKFEWKPNYVTESFTPGIGDTVTVKHDYGMPQQQITNMIHLAAKTQQDYPTVMRKLADSELQDENNQLRFILSILAAVKDDGWIAWHGGRVPPVFDLVDCKLRDGWTWKRVVPDRWSWDHNSWGTDIIAYRIAR